uniref:Uncharacterized protein n=1 Tax=Arundo donax TaxID=35708 RepID=A0A0A9C389_ARUDO
MARNAVPLAETDDVPSGAAQPISGSTKHPAPAPSEPAVLPEQAVARTAPTTRRRHGTVSAMVGADACRRSR